MAIKEIIGQKEGWLNFWRISVLGVLLAISMYVNHSERIAHNEQNHKLMMEIMQCGDLPNTKN